jgi:hypothetical protein
VFDDIPENSQGSIFNMFPSGDPFHKPSAGGKLYNKDYTKFVKWTPLKIAVASLCIMTPYIAIVVVLASVISVGAVIPLIVLPLALMVMVGLVYSVGTLGRVSSRRKHSKYNSKHNSKHNRQSAKR